MLCGRPVKSPTRMSLLPVKSMAFWMSFPCPIALFQQDGAIPTRGAKVYNNTILVPEDGRWGILMTAGANEGTEIYNNIIINQHAWRSCISAVGTNGLSRIIWNWIFQPSRPAPILFTWLGEVTIGRSESWLWDRECFLEKLVHYQLTQQVRGFAVTAIFHVKGLCK